MNSKKRSQITVRRRGGEALQVRHEAQHPSAQNGSSDSVNTVSLLHDESLLSLLTQ